MCTKRRTRGFSLIEMVVAIVVFAAAVGGILQLVTTVVARSADPMVQTQAVYIAQAYLEEALARAYSGPGADCGTPRHTWQVVTDYACIDAEAPRDAQGNALAGLGRYRVTVSVTHANLEAVPTHRVAVLVTHEREPVAIRIAGFRADY